MKTIQVKIKPYARVSALELQEDNTWKASIKSPPVDGKANRELIELAAKMFQCPKSAVTIKSGAGSRVKLFQIADD